jgi:hypothetical protein
LILERTENRARLRLVENVPALIYLAVGRKIHEETLELRFSMLRLHVDFLPDLAEQREEVRPRPLVLEQRFPRVLAFDDGLRFGKEEQNFLPRQLWPFPRFNHSAVVKLTHDRFRPECEPEPCP